MRLAAMALASAVFVSGSVCASEFAPVISDVFWFQGSNTSVTKENVFVEILPNQNGEGYSAKEVTRLDLAYEKSSLGVVFDVKRNTVSFRVPYGIDIDGTTKQFTCGKDVGLGARASYAQPQTSQQATLAFCSSVLIEPVKESFALKGFSKALTLVNGLSSAGTQVITPFQAKLSREKFVEILTRADVSADLSKIRDEILDKEVKEKALSAAKEKMLFDKGQQFIQQSAIGETLCRGDKQYKVTTFIENVRGSKVQLRVNRLILEGQERSNISIGGMSYRNGEVIWSDAALWSACQ